MVNGFDLFRESFCGYEDCYTIIGGTACMILMDEVGLEFRATKDIDMILLIEERFEKFASVFWAFIRAGGYRCGWKNSELPHFYRFTEPQTQRYPFMIELFSRKPDFQLNHPETQLTPLPVSDEISSLSAIMLDDNYYKLMLQGRRIVEGVSVLGAEYLILFKMKAWLDLRQKRADGMHVNERDLKKHKNDVFRLVQLVDPATRIMVSSTVKSDSEQFLRLMRQESVDLPRMGLGNISLDSALRMLDEMITDNATGTSAQ